MPSKAPVNGLADHDGLITIRFTDDYENTKYRKDARNILT